MKIAICTIKGIHFAGGIERSTRELASCLVRKGHEVVVYTMRHHGAVPTSMEGVRIVGVPCIPGASTEKLSASAMGAAKAFLDRTFDIVHFQHVSAGWAACLPRFGRAKVVLQSHGIAWRCSKFQGLGGSVLRMLERIAVRHCDALTVVSKTQVEYYRRLYGVEAIHIPNGVTSQEAIQPQLIRSLGLSRRGYILLVGRLSQEKGVHLLIPAFRRVKTSHRLVIVGKSQDSQYMARLMALAQGDERIMFIGERRGDILQELYSNASLYVQPSELEGLSLALLEAMSFGNCCLVSDIPENIELTDGAAVNFVAGSVDSLRNRLSLLLASPELVRAKRVLAKKRAQEQFSWDRVADRMVALYSSILPPSLPVVEYRRLSAEGRLARAELPP